MFDKFIVGRNIEGIFGLSLSEPPLNPSLPEDFVLFDDHCFHIGRSAGKGFWGRLGAKTAQVGSGVENNEARNFSFLPYIAGKITMVRDTGRDVLSGPMSGCWIVRFCLDGRRYIGHVGTKDHGFSPQSVQVKQSWNDAIASGRVRYLGGFDPIGRYLPEKALKPSYTFAKRFFAGVSANGAFRTLMVGYDEGDVVGLDLMKIRGVYDIPPSFAPVFPI